MKKKMSNKAYIAINASFMSLLVAVMIALMVACIIFSPTISMFLMGVTQTQSEELDRALAEGAELCVDIADEGIVMLKNSTDETGKPTLPLSEEEILKVNVFGWASYDWLTGAFGSGFSNTTLEKLKLFPALERAGIEYNEELRQMYEDFYSSPAYERGQTWDEYRGDANVSGRKKFNLHEPGAGYYTDEVINNASEFSDVALVVIGRVGGEGADLRKYQDRQPQTNRSESTTRDETRHYLELSPEEEEMIEAAKKACDKVIVLLNTFNIPEIGFIDDEGIDACLLVGLTGLTGVNSVINVLDGTVSPSGRTADTIAYDFESAPSFANSGEDGVQQYIGDTETDFDNFIDYTDNIYVGYRYYETAAAENELLYDSVVQYPFGYGLSYTDFEWNVTKIDPAPGSMLPKDGKITIEVMVTNTGDVAGKDVVQLYYTAPYGEATDNNSKIEKSHVVLGAFGKTPLLEPGKSSPVTLELYVQDMASYDDYDKNNNGFKGYELDPGDYSIKLMKNAHELADNIGDMSMTEAEIVYGIDGEGHRYETDRITGEEVTNRFVGDNLIDEIPIDGSEETEPVSYMSRSDFAGTFPLPPERRQIDERTQAVAHADEPTAEQLAVLGDIGEIKTGQPGTMTLNDALSFDGYDDPKWQQLIEQIPFNELIDLIRDGYFKTAAIPSIQKPMYLDFDGPGGFNTQIFGTKKNDFVLYPNATMIAQTWNVYLAYQMGMSVANEGLASDMGVKGWYAPGANIHRSPFGGRNAEYYSEDPYLSGMMCAECVRGAKNKGLYSYIKHWVVNESETGRHGLFTWLTEQSLREIYLRPFELAVKYGGANGLMSAMNRVGAIWSGASRALCTDVLRGEWGFRGMIVTDWYTWGAKYMVPYKGIWAGNDTWLNNPNSPFLTGSDASKYENNDYFIYCAQNVAHNVLYTITTTEKARLAYDPDSEPTDFTVGGFEYNHGWVWMPILVESVLLAGLGVWIFFVVRRVRKNKAPA